MTFVNVHLLPLSIWMQKPEPLSEGYTNLVPDRCIHWKDAIPLNGVDP